MVDLRPETTRQASDGVWEPAAPLGIQGRGLDFEVTSRGRWAAYRGTRCVASGTARTRAGLAVTLWWVKAREGKRRRG